MHAFVALALGSTTTSATPLPTPSLMVDPELVTPGVWGFAIIALLAVAVILLVSDMLRRIRRARVRADIAEELAAEMDADAQRDTAAPSPATDDDTAAPRA
ncbi:hypothetical protein LG299_04040 [Microbacterium lacus]|uniref:hypothetical protein n=1 Tax=Microbacterium lacus TaxID=415217 RepID=UPI00385139E0